MILDGWDPKAALRAAQDAPTEEQVVERLLDVNVLLGLRRAIEAVEARDLCIYCGSKMVGGRCYCLADD